MRPYSRSGDGVRSPIRPPTTAPIAMPAEEPGEDRRDGLGRVAEDQHELARPDDLVDETGRPGQDEDPEDGPARVHPRQVGIDDITRTLQGSRFAPRTLGDAARAGHPDRDRGGQDREPGERQVRIGQRDSGDEQQFPGPAADQRRRRRQATNPPTAAG